MNTGAHGGEMARCCGVAIRIWGGGERRPCPVDACGYSSRRSRLIRGARVIVAAEVA